MNDWQRSFVGKLEVARKHWQQRFEACADGVVTEVFDALAEFTTPHGLSATTPPSETGTRFYKFALTENAYVLLTFRMAGLDRLAFAAEYFIPGTEQVEPASAETALADADEPWVRARFESGLEDLVVAFAKASAELAAQPVAA